MPEGVAQAVPADPGASASDSVPAGTWTLDFEQRWHVRHEIAADGANGETGEDDVEVRDVPTLLGLDRVIGSGDSVTA